MHYIVHNNMILLKCLVHHVMQMLSIIIMIASKDDLEVRRWSYGFENKGKSHQYQPRAPPPRPPSRHISSPEPTNSMCIMRP